MQFDLGHLVFFYGGVFQSQEHFGSDHAVIKQVEFVESLLSEIQELSIGIEIDRLRVYVHMLQNLGLLLAVAVSRMGGTVNAF